MDLQEHDCAHDPPQSRCNKQKNISCKVVKTEESAITIDVYCGMIIEFTILTIFFLITAILIPQFLYAFLLWLAILPFWLPYQKAARECGL